MKNVIYIAFTLLLCFVAYKFGDKQGYEAGYQEGYTYDCQEEIISLRSTITSLSKSVDYVGKAAEQIKRESDSLKKYDARRQYELRADSIERATGVRPISFDSASRRSQAHTRDVMRQYRDKQLNGTLK